MHESKIKTVAHATDLHPEGGIAFSHAVAIARDFGAELVSIHARTMDDDAGRPMPDAEQLTRTWATNRDSDVESVAHTVRNESCCDDPVDTLLNILKDLGHDLLVVGTNQRKGIDRLVRGSVAESLVANNRTPTLVLPIGKRGFVADWSGLSNLRCVVVPVGSPQDLEAASTWIVEFVKRMGSQTPRVHLVHVADSDDAVELSAPQAPGIQWNIIRRKGELVEVLSEVVEEVDADLIAMPTRGQDSFLDVLTGTRTEKTLRISSRPVLIVPVPEAD